MDEIPPKRWWRRIPIRPSVRALMGLVLVSALAIGWVVRRANVQRDAVAAIERAGGKAFYGRQLKLVGNPDFEDLSFVPAGQPRRPKWLVDRLGPDYFGTIRLVIIPGPADPVMPAVGKLGRLEEIDFLPSRKEAGYGPSDAGMVHLRGLTRLRHLKLGVNTAQGAVGSKGVTGAGLANIAGATRLQILQLQGVPLDDADLAALRGLADLRDLAIDSPGVTDAGLEHLAGLTQLRSLGLPNTRVTAAGIGRLRALKRLHKLNLSQTRVESLETCRAFTGLRELDLPLTPITAAGPGFDALVSLNLFQTRVGDPGLFHLRDLDHLRRLVLIGTDVTDAGVDGFKQARPSVNIVRRAPPAKLPPPAPPGKMSDPARSHRGDFR